MGQAARYAEIFLVGLVAALASYNYTITIGNFILPSKVSMYSVKPVLQHDRAFDIFDAGDADKVKSDKKIHDVIYATDFEPTGKHGDFNFYYLTPIQISKFVIRCYGNHSFDDEKLTVSTDYTNDGVNQLKTMLSGTWNSNVVDLWKKGVKDSKPALVTAAKANATKILDIWQVRITYLRKAPHTRALRMHQQPHTDTLYTGSCNDWQFWYGERLHLYRHRGLFDYRSKNGKHSDQER